MKKNKIVKYLVLTIIIILIILILILIKLNKEKTENLMGEDISEEELAELEINDEIEEVEQINTFYMADTIINENIQSGNIFYSNKIYFQETSIVTTYRLYIFGENFDKINRTTQNIFYAIDFDTEKGTYKISQIKQGISLSEFEEIANEGKQKYLINENLVGEFFQEDITDNNVVRRYFEYYKMLILANPEKAYLLINDEYKKIRFENYENFYKYINDNIDNFMNMEFNKFQINYYDEFTQYVSVSNSGEYYIFNVNKIMEFSVLLDQYIVDIPQFTEKYNKSDIRIKIALNINKFIFGINNKNYNYVNNLLADSFKNLKGITNVTELEKYLKNNFYEENDIEFLTFNEQGSYYVYTANLKDKNSDEEKNIKIVMQLNEGTKFKMSFSF